MFSGRKASSDGGGSGSSAPDTLFSDDVVEVILGLSEGPIKGLANGARSFLVADTPLVDTSGTPNLGKFDLQIHPGLHPADKIVAKLGGSGASSSVGVQLETNTRVVRTGSHTQLDYIEVRILIQRLLNIGDKGDGPADVDFRVELKPQSASTWNNAYAATPPPAQSTMGSIVRYTDAGQGVGAQVNPAYHQTFIQTSMPTAPTDLSTPAFWFDSDDSYRPHIFMTILGWQTISGAVQHAAAGATPAYWEWSDIPLIKRRAYYGNTGAAPAGLSLYDFWIAPSGTPISGGTTTGEVSFIWNGSAWVDYMDWAAPPVSYGGDIHINGKTTTTYVKELRIPVNRIDEPYSIGVTKLSPLNTTKYFADITFESFQEITAEPLQFDDLAVAHLTIKSSDQFSSVPEFSGVYEGLIFRVPTNYDPVAKTYSGLWDGTFKLAYSNNPAWFVYELVNNDRFGMAAYCQTTLDKYDVYAFGQHCDAHGFTYNDWMTDARNLTEAIDYICGIAGGRFVDPGDGFATILFDADDQPAVHLFTPENVVDGVFSYAFTDTTSRINDCTVSFVNEDYNWIEDRRRVFDSDAIALHGRNPEEFVAVGCTNEVEAIKRTRLRLAVAQGEKAICSWKTNRQGLYIKPYSIVLVGDPDSGFGLSGRITSVIDATHIQIRDPLYFEAGLDYTIQFAHAGATGLEILTYDLVTSVGSTMVLTLATPLTETLADQCNFSIGAEGDVGAPKAYRITNFEEVDGEPDNISITAIEVNRNKWAFVDGLYTPPNVHQTGQIGNNTFPVSNVRVEGQTTSDGIHNIVMQWDASPSPLTRYNRIYFQINGGSIQVLTETRDTRYTLLGAQPATYSFSIVAVNMDGQESPPVSFQHEVLGAVRAVSPPLNLQLLDGVDPTTYRTRNPAFSWEESNDPFLALYRIRIYNQSTGLVLRTVDTTITSYVYDYATNALDFGTPSRTFRLELRAVDKAGSESQPLVKLVTNAMIPAPTTVTLSSKFFALYLDVTKPTDADYRGMIVYGSATNGFTPGPSNVIYDGPDCSFRTTLLAGDTLYVRVGFKDTFDDATTLSAQFAKAGAGLDPGTVTYAALTTTALNTIQQSAHDDAFGLVDSLHTVLSGADAALSTRIDSLTTTVGTNTASITSEITTRASADTALGGRIDTLTTTVGTNTAAITAEAAARATQDTAIATQITSLTTTVGANTAAITAEQTARSNADTTIASSVTTLTTTVNGNSTAITTNAAAVTALNGAVYGQWNVQITTQSIVGGTTRKVVSGFGLAQVGGGGATTSDFVISVDRFFITPTYDPANPIAVKAVFAVGNINGVAEVGISGNMVIDGSLTARTLAVTSLSAVSANLGTVTAGVAKSSDDKFHIDFTGGYLLVSD